jgi:hypothetical protein
MTTAAVALSLALLHGAPAQEASTPKCGPGAAASDAPDASKTVRVLVLELTTSGGFESSVRTLSQVVAEEAARVTGYEIVSTEEVRAMLDAEAQKALLGCDASSCLAEVAGALDADLLVSGQIDAAPDGAPVLTMSLLNTRAVVTVNRVSLPWRGDPGLLAEVARTATQRLVFEKENRPPGGVVVEGAPDGATVLVDAVDRTSDAVTSGAADLEVGPHEVRVLADGFVPATRHVVVTSGKKVTVDGALEPAPLWTSWWVWAGAGAAVVAAVSGTVALLALTGPADVTISESLQSPTLASVEAVKGGAP